MTRGISASAIALAAAAAWGGAALSRAAEPVLDGRAVLPVNTHAPGPPSGAFRTADTNSITFPTPSQPVEGFSALTARPRHIRRRRYLQGLPRGAAYSLVQAKHTRASAALSADQLKKEACIKCHSAGLFSLARRRVGG